MVDPLPEGTPDERARVAATVTLITAATDDSDAGPAEVATALDQLGVSGPRAAELVEQVYRARREHTRLRRREHELAALYSSARELAELRDNGALLKRLVQRAHEMMGGDVTYLSEFDPVTRELHVRVTSGSVSAVFRGLRVPPGRGLASVIVETRTARWANRYDDYRADRHEKGIDDAVAAEGIISLLGVPMLTGDDVLGVLFVANREQHEFGADEIALLSALADHASIVLQTTRVLDELRRSEDETRQALDRLTEHLTERDRANTVHQELVHAVLAGGGFAPVADTLASALGRTVAIVDDRGTVIAASGPPPALPGLGERTTTAIEESARSGHCVLVEGVEGLGSVAALAAGPRHFGAMLLGPGEFELGPVDRRTVERAAQVCALLALRQEAVTEAEHRVRNEIVADLLDAAPERRADVERRVRRLGVVLDELDALVLLSVTGEHRAATAHALGVLLGDRALVGEYRSFVVALYASHRQSLDLAGLRTRVASAIQSPVLVVAPPCPVETPTTAFTLAMRTTRLLVALGVDDTVAVTDDYLPYAAVLDSDAGSLTAFLDDTIGAVRRYDAERGTDLVRTVRAFVRNNASPTRTARALKFHPNTILQRVERLDRILGSDWRDDERLFRIGVAVRLDELRERLSPPG